MQINLLEYLEQSAENNSSKPAFCDEKRVFTFSELLFFSRQLGTQLISYHVLRRPVAVFVRRDAISVALFCSVLQAGGFYVPIDPTQPLERLKVLLNTINPAAILCRPNEFELAQSLAVCPILTEEDCIEPNLSLLNSVRADLLDIDPAYLIFTSGSTGTPKGIAVSHRGVIDLTDWLATEFNFVSEDILGNQTPFYFDASVKDIYLTLKCGLTTHIISKKYFSFPSRLIDFLNEYQITTILWATSAVQLVALSGILELKQPSSLKRVFFAGEQMTGKTLMIWKRALPDISYINLYGPTEVTVDCAFYRADQNYADDESIPIGRACRNMQLLLLNEQMQPVSRGEVGELYVRGTGVALGYYGDKQRTSMSFLQNPLNAHWNDLIYRTGDLAYQNQDGDYVFTGRRDDQIKRHGNRIELGDIESAAKALSFVKEAACIYSKENDTLLLVWSGNNTDDVSLLTILAEKLPRYMLPDKTVWIEAMPHTPNGKLDRTAVRALL